MKYILLITLLAFGYYAITTYQNSEAVLSIKSKMSILEHNQSSNSMYNIIQFSGGKEIGNWETEDFVFIGEGIKFYINGFEYYIIGDYQIIEKHKRNNNDD